MSVVVTIDALENWRLHAACRDDPERQFPGHNSQGIVEAKRVCRRCPVRPECLADALRLGDDEGVWGGLTPTERRLLSVQRTCPCSKVFHPTQAGQVWCPSCRTKDAAVKAKERAACGTKGGYERHVANGESACGPCLDANANMKVPACEKVECGWCGRRIGLSHVGTLANHLPPGGSRLTGRSCEGSGRRP